MKKAGIIGIIILVVAVITGGMYFYKQTHGAGQPDTAIAPEEAIDFVGGTTTIIHKDFRAIIKSDWQETEASPSIFVYLPPGTAQDDINAEVISIITTFLGEGSQYTLESLLNQGINSSKQIMPDFNLTEAADWENDNLVGKKIKFTGTQEGIKRNSVQVFGMEYDNLYAITYSCPVDSCNSYAVYNSLIESFEPVKAVRK